MSDDDQVTELEDVEWLTDDDGTEYFVHDGRRYELGDDGYAYDVGPSEPGGADGHGSGVEGSSEPAPAGVADEPATEQDDAAGRSDATEEDAASDVLDGSAPSRETTETTRLPAATSAATDNVPGGNGHGSSAGRSPALAEAPGTNGASGDGTPMLRVRGLRSGYGALPVLHGIDMDIATGSTAVLLGLNGAGKTTTATNICGMLDVWGGTIELEGTDITSWGVGKCVRSGVVLVPEGRRVFPDLSVDRNLQIGAWQQRKDSDWVAEQREQVLEYFPRLRERLGQNAGTLSGGEQQMLAIARGLMARPRLLIIDEASMGLAPVIVSQVFEIIQQINRDGVTVLMIEQNVGALDVADVAIVMEQGTIIRELTGDELTDRTLVSQTLMG